MPKRIQPGFVLYLIIIISTRWNLSCSKSYDTHRSCLLQWGPTLPVCLLTPALENRIYWQASICCQTSWLSIMWTPILLQSYSLCSHGLYIYLFLFLFFFFLFPLFWWVGLGCHVFLALSSKPLCWVNPLGGLVSSKGNCLTVWI